MFRERDSLSQHRESELNSSNPDDNFLFKEKGIDYFNGSEMGRDGFLSKPSKFGNSSSQELTLSYLCDANSKLNFHEKDFDGKISLGGLEKSNNHKGKEIAVGENCTQWVERDFLQFDEIRATSSKRDVEKDEFDKREIREKKPTLNLSLGLPDVSSSHIASNALQNVDVSTLVRPKPSRSVQSLAPSNNNTQTTCSNDFTAASHSYSYSHPFSHNPSCSLTRNSNYEYSVTRENDQIWNCGEGTNGSVHSRFKPNGDGVSLSNHDGGIFPLIQGNRTVNRDSCNSLQTTHRPTGSDSHLFFPSELPAKPGFDNISENSRGRGSDHLRNVENFDGGNRASNLSRPERIVREIVFESIPTMAQTIQELPLETLDSIKGYLKDVITEKKEELANLQSSLERRSDLNNEMLLKASKNQLDIMVAIKTGLKSFLSNNLPPVELIEIFLLTRCLNINCKSLLPVDDCDCKICSGNKGFCSSCMCPICLNFDCASNTCSWVGCDVCSHWCHAACGIQKNLIKPGPSLKGPKGTSEMQFHCLGCGHASEMFGFVKDVFVCCAKDWGLQTLVKELDCVRKIFQASDDFKGKQLHTKAGEMLVKIDKKMISPSDACIFLTQFFNYTDGMTDFPSLDMHSKDLTTPRSTPSKDTITLPQTNPLLSNYSMFNMSSSNLQQNLLPHNQHQNEIKNEDSFQFGKPSQKDGFDNLESIVRIKEAEARLFQTRADEARREAEGYRRMVRARSEKMEEEYEEKLSKLCLQETEERRRKKKEELNILENSQCDYYKMKMRMQAEIAGLLERMESTRRQWV